MKNDGMPPPVPVPSRGRFPAALLGSYGVAAGFGLGSIPVGTWVCNSTRDPTGMGFMLFSGLGFLVGGSGMTILSIVSLRRRERARGLAIANLGLMGAALAFIVFSVVASLAFG